MLRICIGTKEVRNIRAEERLTQEHRSAKVKRIGGDEQKGRR
jgi:hypothetical protein